MNLPIKSRWFCSFLCAALTFSSSEGTTQEPRFTHLVLGAEELRAELQGDPDANYRIEISTNLTDWIPLLTNYASNLSRPVFLPRSDSILFIRALEVGRQPAFREAVHVLDTIDFNGKNASFNSFDSTDMAFSTNGKYDAAKRKDGAHISARLGLTNSLNGGSVRILGHVAVKEDSSLAIGPYGAIGSIEWIDAGNRGIQPGWMAPYQERSFPEVRLASEALTTPISGGVITNGTVYDYILSSGNWALTNASFTGKVLVTGNATLYIGENSSVTFSGWDQITIQTNASLKLYVRCASAYIGGHGVIVQDGDPKRFQYFGYPENQSLNWTVNALCVGLIYAPSATVALGGGGHNTYDYVGSIISKSLRFNGHFYFHYDEALINTRATFD